MRRDSILAAITGKGLTSAEIAKAIGCSRSRVRVHIRRLVDEGTLEVERRSTGRGGIKHVYTIASPVPLLQRVWKGRHDSPQP